MYQATEVAQWLESGAVSIGGVDVTLSPLSTPIRTERVARHEQREYELLDWPSEQITFAYHPGGNPFANEPLLANGCPSFVNLSIAARYVLGLTGTATADPSNNNPMLRRQDLSGRIDRVKLSPTEVEVAYTARHSKGWCSNWPGTPLAITGDYDRRSDRRR